jgi:hypothetical protein
LQGNQAEFLHLASTVIDNEDLPEHKLKLFLAVCQLYQGYPLVIAKELYKPMLEYMLE